MWKTTIVFRSFLLILDNFLYLSDIWLSRKPFLEGMYIINYDILMIITLYKTTWKVLLICKFIRDVNKDNIITAMFHDDPLENVICTFICFGINWIVEEICIPWSNDMVMNYMYTFQSFFICMSRIKIDFTEKCDLQIFGSQRKPN